MEDAAVSAGGIQVTQPLDLIVHQFFIYFMFYLLIKLVEQVEGAHCEQWQHDQQEVDGGFGEQLHLFRLLI